jgi:hypothetical protein
VTWWDDLWNWAEDSQLGSNVVGGLIVALIVAAVALTASLVKSSWRKKIWGRLTRFLRGLLTIRVTTTYRQARALRESSAKLEQRTLEAEQELTNHASRIEALVATKDRIQGELNHAHEQLQRAAENVPSDGTAPSVIASREPRWTIYPDAHGEWNDFLLRNSVDGSVAKEVRLEAPVADFDFHDGAVWDDVTGVKIVSFRGNQKGKSFSSGTEFKVYWDDVWDQRREATVTLRKPDSPF